MSHFVIYVMIPNDVSDVEGVVEKMLEPYDEEISVDPYEETCHCVGNKARDGVWERLNNEFGDFRKAFRESYWNAVEALIPEGLKYGMEKYDEAEENAKSQLPSWEEWIKDYTDAKEKYLEEHPLKNSADSDCEDCNGTGVATTTYNPKSKWDWWQIGGRWTGCLTDYDPNKDPDNIETCWLCKGTGERHDDVVDGECNGCEGKGKRIKWPTDWKQRHDDTLDARYVLGLMREDDGKIPFALITPDGEWHERGKMGWFAMVSGEKDKDGWSNAVLSLVEQHMEGHMIVVCDLHI